MSKTITTFVVIILLAAGVWLIATGINDTDQASDMANDGTEMQASDTETERENSEGADEITDESGNSSVEDNQTDGNREETSATDSTEVKAQAETSGETSVDQTVVLTSDGFRDRSVTVSQGDTVRFVNESSGPMWVASDVHPSHTQYAGTSLREHCQSGAGQETAFDQCEEGASFSFTFEKTGEWDYHNHSNPSQTGTVIVE